VIAASAVGLVAAVAAISLAPVTLAANSARHHHRGAAPATPPQPGSPGAPAPSPATPRLELALKGAGGNPPFLLAGQKATLIGTVTPYVPGQQAVVSLAHHGREPQAVTVPINPSAGGQGAFAAPVRSARPGTLTVIAAHAATPQMGVFVPASLRIRVARHSAHRGSSGVTVRVLQSELARLHYALSINGRFDSATSRAVIAYRKLAGLARVPSVNSGMLRKLQRGRGSFHVRYPGHGRHVEANLSAQVLAEILPGGHVRRIYPMSSGKPSTPTVVGHFHVSSKTPGTNQKGMVDSNYFIGGYAIHGYPDVPVHAASHGCLRIPIPDAAPVFHWTRIGTPVDVYSRHGGSHRVRHHGVGP
jgi:hypothetical protein